MFIQDDPGFVIQTDRGNYFKVRLLGATMTMATLEYEQLRPPNDPPAMLADLGGFIAAPTAGTIAPLAAKLLGAKVDLAVRLLAQGHPKAAVALLRILIAESKVLPARFMSADARAEVIAQANAIIAAINR